MDFEVTVQEELLSPLDYWSLHFSMNLKVAPKLYNYLYKDATVFLKRKEQILNTVLNTVDKRTVSV